MIKPSLFERKRASQKREKKDRIARVRKLNDKREMLRALLETYEKLRNFHEVRQLKVRLRTCEQQLKYMRHSDFEGEGEL
jgi:hypothetical protein